MNLANNDAQRKADGLFALANVAEREGRMDAALALSRWASEAAPFVPYTDDEIAALRRDRNARRLRKGGAA